MRIRIALTTAIAVITGMTTGILTLSTKQAPSAHRAALHASPATPTSVLSNTSLAGFAIPAVTVPIGATRATRPTPTPAPVAKAIPTPAPISAPVVKAAASQVPAPTEATPPVTVVVSDATSVDTPDWTCIRTHESGGRYNSPAAPDGAYGILISTWRSFGLSGYPYQAAPSEQDQVALELYGRYGFHPWSSRFACGL